MTSEKQLASQRKWRAKNKDSENAKRREKRHMEGKYNLPALGHPITGGKQYYEEQGFTRADIMGFRQ